MSEKEKAQLDEQNILRRLVKGDQRALEEVLYLYEKPIFNHLLRLTSNYDEASDLLQETFIRLYRNRAKIDSSNNFKNWIYKIATNIAYDHFRKQKREKTLSLDDSSVAETFEQEISYSNLEQEIAEHDLAEALKMIPPQYRAVLLLYYRERFSYEEISDILTLPLNTVKTHLRRARFELSNLLKNTYG